jgi:hypothetical protein
MDARQLPHRLRPFVAAALLAAGLLLAAPAAGRANEQARPDNRGLMQAIAEVMQLVAHHRGPGEHALLAALRDLLSVLLQQGHHHHHHAHHHGGFGSGMANVTINIFTSGDGRQAAGRTGKQVNNPKATHHMANKQTVSRQKPPPPKGRGGAGALVGLKKHGQHGRQQGSLGNGLGQAAANTGGKGKDGQTGGKGRGGKK